MTSEQLNQAIQLIKTGDKQGALLMLKEILLANPRDENAWLLLYSCVDDVIHKKFCLGKALEINPDNERARSVLRELTDPITRPIKVERAAPPKETPPQPAPLNKSSAKENNRSRFFAAGAGLLAFLCLASLIYLAQTGQFPAIAAGLPFFASFTLTPSLTPAPTATPSPIPTFTATLRPSRTPPNTPTPTLTIPPFTPGNPTATPPGSDIADSNFQKGVAEYNAQHYEKAVTLMSAVIETSPELASPYRYRGAAYWYLGNCASGLADEEKALAINPDYALAWMERSLLKECLGDQRQTLQDYQKALSLDPSLSFVHFNLGVYYYKTGNYEKSLQEYRLSVSIDPTRSGGWTGESEALFRLGRYEECVSNANQALQVNREEWLAYSDRAACELEQAKYTEAIDDYKTYADHNPTDPQALYNVGVAYGNRANFYYGSGQYNLAIPDYQKALSIMQGDEHSSCYLAYSYFGAKQYQNAFDAAQSSIDINPAAIDPACGEQKLLEIQARALYALGDYKQARFYISKALMKSSFYPLGYYYRGIFFQADHREESAIVDLEWFLNSGYTGKEIDDAKARLAEMGLH